MYHDDEIEDDEFDDRRTVRRRGKETKRRGRSRGAPRKRRGRSRSRGRRSVSYEDEDSYDSMPDTDNFQLEYTRTLYDDFKKHVSDITTREGDYVQIAAFHSCPEAQGYLQVPIVGQGTLDRDTIDEIERFDGCKIEYVPNPDTDRKEPMALIGMEDPEELREARRDAYERRRYTNDRHRRNRYRTHPKDVESGVCCCLKEGNRNALCVWLVILFILFVTLGIMSKYSSLPSEIFP